MIYNIGLGLDVFNRNISQRRRPLLIAITALVHVYYWQQIYHTQENIFFPQ